jgi:hypothetical protein
MRTTLLVSAFLLGVWALSSCKKDDEPKGTDLELYEMAKATEGFTWYKLSGELLDKSAGSGHNFPFLRTRYNAEAATQLDPEGKIKADAAFPEGSLVVKELFENGSSLSRYAILYKDSGHADADANGWVWGYINGGGSVAEPASKKGTSCIGCHTQDGSIDYMLMNKFFP